MSRILDEAPEEERWQGTLPCLLNISPQSTAIAQLQRGAAEVPRINLDTRNSFAIRDLECSFIQYAESQNPQNMSYLVERFSFDTRINDGYRDFANFQERVCDTARMLEPANPYLMSILRCPGVGEPQKHSFDLLYEVPCSLVQPRSLRNLLQSQEGRTKDGVIHPLDCRIELANSLATAVHYVHSGHFVHKKIKPENIVLFYTEGSQQFPDLIGHAFLVGFDRSRP